MRTMALLFIGAVIGYVVRTAVQWNANAKMIRTIDNTIAIVKGAKK